MAYTLLLADDNRTVQRVVDLTFADGDITVVAAGDGDAALASLDNRAPDIVLADVGLPGKSGYEIAQYVKQHPRLSHVPVLLMTGAFDPVDASRAEASGYDGILTKPLDPKGLVRRVKELLERPASTSSTPAHAIVPAPSTIEVPPVVSAPLEEPLDADGALAVTGEEKPFAFDDLFVRKPTVAPLDLNLREPLSGFPPADSWTSKFGALPEPPADEPAKTTEPASRAVDWLLRAEPPTSKPDTIDRWLRSSPEADEPARPESARHVFELPAPEPASDKPDVSWFKALDEPIESAPPAISFEPRSPEAVEHDAPDLSWFKPAPDVEEPVEPETASSVFELPEHQALEPQVSAPQAQTPDKPGPWLKPASFDDVESTSDSEVFELPDSEPLPLGVPEPERREWASPQSSAQEAAVPEEEEHPVFDISEPEPFAIELLSSDDDRPAAEPEKFEPPVVAQARPADVDTYFEELDLAISSLASTPRRIVPAPESVSPPPVETPPPAKRALVTAAPRSLADAFATLLAAEQGKGSGFEVPGSGFEQGKGSGFEATDKERSDAVAAFAYEPMRADAETTFAHETERSHEVAPVPAAVAPAAPAISREELVDRVAQLALDRMTGDEVRAIVESIVTNTAEKLIREEIERIKSNIK